MMFSLPNKTTYELFKKKIPKNGKCRSYPKSIYPILFNKYQSWYFFNMDNLNQRQNVNVKMFFFFRTLRMLIFNNWKFGSHRFEEKKNVFGILLVSGSIKHKKSKKADANVLWRIAL